MIEHNKVITFRYGPELFNEQRAEKLLGTRDTKLYQAIAGSLLYLAEVTRYEICRTTVVR